MSNFTNNEPLKVNENAMMQYRDIAPELKRDHDSILGSPASNVPTQVGVKRTKTEQACANCRSLRRKVRPGFRTSILEKD